MEFGVVRAGEECMACGKALPQHQSNLRMTIFMLLAPP
jgi:hypothetical protein